MLSSHSGVAEDSNLLGCDSVSLDEWPRRFERPKCLRLKTKSSAVKSAHCNGAARRFSQRYDRGRVSALGWRHQMVMGQCCDVSVFLFIFILSRYRQGLTWGTMTSTVFCPLWTTSIKKCPLRAHMSSVSILWHSVPVHSRREIKDIRPLHYTHITVYSRI